MNDTQTSLFVNHTITFRFHQNFFVRSIRPIVSFATTSILKDKCILLLIQFLPILRFLLLYAFVCRSYLIEPFLVRNRDLSVLLSNLFLCIIYCIYNNIYFHIFRYTILTLPVIQLFQHVYLLGSHNPAMLLSITFLLLL